jgi:GNAT superfamily N-acetyltransferase
MMNDEWQVTCAAVLVLKTTTDFDLVTVSAAGSDANTVRDLFLEYGESLSFNTCFGGLDQELATLPGDYAPPCGCLLLAKEGGTAAGCVGVRPLDESGCEMKRLFVRPHFRRAGLGRRLGETAITRARAMGYRRVFLDMLPTMLEARARFTPRSASGRVRRTTTTAALAATASSSSARDERRGVRSFPAEGEASMNIRPIIRSPRSHPRLLPARRLGEQGSRLD